MFQEIILSNQSTMQNSKILVNSKDQTFLLEQGPCYRGSPQVSHCKLKARI